MAPEHSVCGDPPTRRGTAHGSRIAAGGVELAVREHGPATGIPVVVLHGFTGSAIAMDPLTERLAAALPGRIICPDLIGHGNSEAPDDLDVYRVEAMAGQVAALANALGCDPFHLVGYSMGGRVALTLACAEPQRLRSLCLIGASAGIADPEQRRRRVQADDARAQRILDDLGAFVDEWMAGPLFAGQATLGDTHLRAGRDQRLASDPAGLARSLRAGGTGSMTPLHDRLGGCEVPTLALAGAHDTKFGAIAEQLVAAMPNCTAASVDGAGHATHLERPDATASEIAAFIAGVEAHPAGKRISSSRDAR